MERLLTRNVGRNVAQDISFALEHGAYGGLRKAMHKMSPEGVIAEIEKAQLRGRGGAGFPTGRKWRLARAEAAQPKWVVCNADEGEPGTFKDRVLLRHDPHLILEALILAGWAIGAEQGFIYIRGEYFREVTVLQKAIEQARHQGFLGPNILGSGYSFDIKLYVGAGAYICGDETALIQSMEGRRGQPREKPPFPVAQGFLNKPTIINNVETLCNVPFIVERGGEWYASIGPEGSRGPKLFCLSGHVNKPGVYELPMGLTLRYLIEKFGGGLRGGRFKAALPGGVASSLLNSADVKMDFESLRRAGSMMGSGAVIVMNESTDMVKAARNVNEYFIKESCGQCTPCREGNIQVGKIIDRILRGGRRDGDIEKLKELAGVMRDTSRCGLGQSAMCAVLSAVELFPDEFQHYSPKVRCAQ